ncbi:MAG: hypothetical protein QNJ49_16820 [Mastigocoleus sp. MO_167.B18]|uniref:hypothetical protein n=1 Tax=Mastigocoleus sp. MO_188.B34 TaxID=3036635 RepID=UPI0026360190|nr:hypothetical protein [Mastigocoleus sp. MO_188.B34]MDJ0696734.1 hypothetical protein [Mastigocoleus sp. MO_188.B34]MDJ0775061.1 hypothetical protein [Mastigocoleus sp. MO_167.B18]
MNFEFLADRTDAIPVVAKWYFDEWGYSVPGNSIQKTVKRISGKLNRDKAPLHMLAIENEKILGLLWLIFRRAAEMCQTA